MKIIKYLKQNILFANMDENEMNNVFNLINGKIVKYPKGRIICKENSRYDQLYVILEGLVLTYHDNEFGQKEAISSLGVGDMLNELDGFIKDRNISYSAAILEEAIILNIDIASILSVNGTEDKVGAKFLNNIFSYYASRINDLAKNKNMMAIKSMRVKVSKLIYDKYQEQNDLQINMGMNRNEMAEYLSVSRPSMSREMIRMREEGIIKFRKENIEILDLDKLISILK